MMCLLALAITAAPTEIDAQRTPSPEAAERIACRTWQHLADGLSAEQGRRLANYGAVHTARGFVLSELLVPECAQRLALAGYLDRIIGGRPLETDPDFATRHSEQIVGVVRALWPEVGGADVLIDEGLEDERYALLKAPGLRERDLAPLLVAVLEADGLRAEVVAALLERPVSEARPVVQRLLAEAEATDNVHDKIYAFVLLHQMGDRGALARLRALRASDQLSNFEREFLPRLIARVETGRPLRYADLEEMEIYNER